MLGTSAEPRSGDQLAIAQAQHLQGTLPVCGPSPPLGDGRVKSKTAPKLGAGNQSFSCSPQPRLGARVDRPLVAVWSRLGFANERPVCTSLLTFGSSWQCSRHGIDIEPIEGVIHPLSCLAPQFPPPGCLILPLHLRTRPIRNVAPVVQAELGEAAQPVAAGTRAAISFSGSSAGGPR